MPYAQLPLDHYLHTGEIDIFHREIQFESRQNSCKNDSTIKAFANRVNFWQTDMYEENNVLRQAKKQVTI